MMAPACSRRSIIKALPVAILSFQSGLPNVVGRPATLNDSLTVIEMPCNGPQRSPRARAASAARAAFSRLVDLPDDDCVQRRIMPFRARQVEVEQFDAADVPVANFV